MTAKRIFTLIGVSLILLSCDRDLIQNTNDNPQKPDEGQYLQKDKKDSINLNGETNPPKLETIIDSNNEEPKIPPRK